jgi:hypothetical protein
VLSFSTFRTQQPSSTFFGISNVSVPVSSDAITAATIAQTGDAVGPAIADGLGGWTVTVLVPVDISVSGTALGAPFEQVFAGAFALNGSASPSKDGITLSLQAQASETAPIPPAPPLVAVPFPLPTILPPGSTANLLLDATFSEGSVTSSLTTTNVATGASAEPTPDINGDGVVGGPDLAILLAAWETADAAADLNGNGVVDGPDLSILLAAWQ